MQFEIPQEYVGSRIVSRETTEKLRLYHSLLLKWQKTINLVSPNTLDDAWNRHFLDSAHVVRLLPETENKTVLADMGSGAGFPGLVIAAICPDITVHLIESDNRKSQFLKTVIRETGLSNATVHIERVENVSGLSPDYITARAFAPLSDLMKYSSVIGNPDTKLLFMKGAGWKSETDDLLPEYKNRKFESVSGLTADGGVILYFP